MTQYLPSNMGTMSNSSAVSGIYRARVENNIDPLKIGRVQVRIPMLHGMADSGLSVEGLPWAFPCFQSAGYGYGSFMVPEVGEYVFIIFEDNDSSKPVYIGSSFGSGASAPKVYGTGDGKTWQGDANSNEVPKEAQREYPTEKVIYKSPKGSCISIDEEDGQESINITDPLGQMLKFESNLVRGSQHKRFEGDMDSLSKASSSDTT